MALPVQSDCNVCVVRLTDVGGWQEPIVSQHLFIYSPRWLCPSVGRGMNDVSLGIAVPAAAAIRVLRVILHCRAGDRRACCTPHPPPFFLSLPSMEIWPSGTAERGGDYTAPPILASSLSIKKIYVNAGRFTPHWEGSAAAAPPSPPPVHLWRSAEAQLYHWTKPGNSLSNPLGFVIAAHVTSGSCGHRRAR